MQIVSQSCQRWSIRKALKHESKPGCFFAIGDQPLIFGRVAVRHVPAVPESFLSPLVHLVAGTIRRHFAFKLREVEKHIPQQAAHRILRVQTLRHRNEFDAVSVENVHELMEVSNRTRQAVNLVGKYAIQLSFSQISEHLFERGTVEESAEYPPSS